MLNIRAYVAVAVSTALLIGQEKVDLTAIHQIKAEAFQNSKVMDHMFYLTDVHGPRLSGSPGYNRAAEWAASRMREIGLKNVKLEKWGPFGRGWEYTKFSAHLLEPSYQPLIGFPLAWTAGTNGVVTGEPVIAALNSEADFEKHKGKLAGRIVMIEPLKRLELSTRPLARRWTDQELKNMEEMEVRAPRMDFDFRPNAPIPPDAPPEIRARMEQRRLREKIQNFLRDEKPAVILQTGYRGDGGTVFGAGGGSREPQDKEKPPVPATIALTPEHYNRIYRLLEKKIPVKVEIEVKAQFFDDTPDSVNVIGEIEGGSKKDEIVMIGAHLDSWHGATGATDNAAGSSVMLEVMRILKTMNARLDRTVRIALWGGEEQGLLGSRAYVKEHFADRETMNLTDKHARLSAYYNIDNGTGKIRGIYLQGNDMVRPIFEEWLKPFHDLGATHITIRNTGGTDHLAFDAVGLAGFQFIQDPTEYESRTHHSNMDFYDRIQPGDMMQMSAIVASFVYHTANRGEMLPRKPLPKPQPARRGGSPSGQ
ncbi:MAG: M20/M25/M40 family metallo-hydrolase [Bryobacteraceae bacterium]|nr:M20/M25/M40 family metallo-hydrolase [Bryobacteraceae bacterium]